MKKWLSLFLAVTLCATFLVGCGSGDKEGTDDKDSKTLRISGLNGGYGTEGWEAVAKAFEEKTGVKVELTLEKNIAEVLRPVITSGKDVPDLIYLSVGSEGGLVDTMISEKAITEITDVLDMKVYGEEELVKDKLLPGFTSSFNTAPYGDGKLYLAPFTYDPCGLFYNAALFEEKGWKVPETWDEMWELGETAKAEGIALFTYPTTGYFDAFFSALLNGTAGEDAYSKAMQYDVSTWESEDVKQAFEIVGKLKDYTHENTVSQANDTDFTKNQQLILDNKALFCPNGTWLPDEMKDAPRAESFEWGFTALPKVTEDEKAYSATFSEQVYIPSKAQEVDLAKEFITFMYSDEAAKIFAEKSNCVLPTITASEFIPEKWTDSDGNEVDNQKTLFYQIYDNGAAGCSVGFKSVDTIEGVDLTSAKGILYGTVDSVMSGDKTADEWYDSVIEAVKKYSEVNQ